MKGISKYGVGKMDKIKSELLDNWDIATLKLRTMRLFGTQNIERIILLRIIC